MIDFSAMKSAVEDAVRKAVETVGSSGVKQTSFFASSQGGKIPVFVVINDDTDEFYAVFKSLEEADDYREKAKKIGDDAELDVRTYWI